MPRKSKKASITKSQPMQPQPMKLQLTKPEPMQPQPMEPQPMKLDILKPKPNAETLRLVLTDRCVPVGTSSAPAAHSAETGAVLQSGGCRLSFYRSASTPNRGAPRRRPGRASPAQRSAAHPACGACADRRAAALEPSPRGRRTTAAQRLGLGG